MQQLWKATRQTTVSSIWSEMSQVRQLNHFAKYCQSKHTVQYVGSNKKDNSDNLFIGAVSKTNKKELQTDECYTTLVVETVPVKFKVDTGVQVNILLLHTFNNLNTETSLVSQTQNSPAAVAMSCVLEAQLVSSVQIGRLNFM